MSRPVHAFLSNLFLALSTNYITSTRGRPSRLAGSQQLEMTGAGLFDGGSRTTTQTLYAWYDTVNCGYCCIRCLEAIVCTTKFIVLKSYCLIIRNAEAAGKIN